MAQPGETPTLIHATSAAKIVDDFPEIIGLFGCF